MSAGPDRRAHLLARIVNRPEAAILVVRREVRADARGFEVEAIAGFGRHGGRHEPRFGELPGSQAILVEFLLSEDDARRLVDSLAGEPVALTYAQWPVEFGLVGGRS